MTGIFDRPRLRRREAAQYLLEQHGIPVAVATLAKYASVGGGPCMTYAGRIPLYDKTNLDDWANAKLHSARSTAEKVAS